jgi:hypothetical protein
MLAAVLGAVETWPGSVGASRKHFLPASLDRDQRPEQMAGRDEGTPPDRTGPKRDAPDPWLKFSRRGLRE